MGRHIQAEPLPTFDQISTKDGRTSEHWLRWFTRVRYLLSNESHQLITSAGAVDINAKYVKLSNSTGGSIAITLEAPTLEGKLMIIERTGGTDDITLSLANCTGGSAATTCTWNSSNDQLVLLSCNAKWLVMKENGVVLT